MAREFILSWNNHEQDIVFPVIPSEGINVQSEQSNTTYDGMNGQLQLIGRRQLRTFSIESFFPMNKTYTFANKSTIEISKRLKNKPADTTAYVDPTTAEYVYEYQPVYDGLEIIKMIETVRDRKIPFRAIYTDNGVEVFNMAVSITSLDWGFDLAGDINYSMTFLEYLFPTFDSTELAQDPEVEGVDTENKECDISEFQTTSELSGASGTAYSPTKPVLYTEHSVTLMCQHICSSLIFTRPTYYIDDATYMMYPEQTGSYTRAVSRETLYAGEIWLMLNVITNSTLKGFRDENGNKIGAFDGVNFESYLAQCLNDKHYDHRASTYGQYEGKYNNIYGFDLWTFCADIMGRWSDEYQGVSSVGRTIPKDYVYYYGSYKTRYTTYKGLRVCYPYLFNKYCYDSNDYFKKYMFTDGSAWNFSIAY